MRLLLVLLWLFAPSLSQAQDPGALIKAAIEYWRGKSSYTEAEMIVHRPDWERRMSMRAWTDGNKHTLVRFTAPAKDAGNASLTIDEDTWSFNPKINKAIQIPPSMRAQSWMGSDFSYDDLSKADRIVSDYTHRLLGTEVRDGKKVYTIEALPRESAPVVWGREMLVVREDYIILEHRFYDQDGHLVKEMRASEIKPLGGRMYATIIRMSKSDEPDEWTEVHHVKAEFDAPIPATTFTIAALGRANP
ncbi:MAG: outer membrane lipoprotein-sorting protein [Oligoflexia bacterium]|nr:outer membrane lipoprotein-sorting protein [Oligoflexia bacterium]